MKNLFFLFISFACITSTYAQIGIKANNTAPISSAQLEVQSTTKAFYPPRMTTAQRTTMPNPPLAGAMVFDTDLNGLFTFNGSSWVSGSGLTLPFTGSQSINGLSLFNVTNTNTSNFIPVMNASTNSSSGGVAVSGMAATENPTGNSTGVRGFNASINNFGSGVEGVHDGGGAGVSGRSETGSGIRGISLNGIGGSFSSPNGGYALITNVGNVGIGIPTPLEKLHVLGNIRASSLAGTGVRDVRADANGNLITTAPTYTLSIGPTAFSPVNNNSGTYISLGVNNTGFMSAGSTDFLAAPILLPDGATITSMVLYYTNTSTVNKFSSSLNANPYQVISFTNLIFGTTTSTSSTPSSIVTYNLPIGASNVPINNSTNSYFIYVFPVLVSTGANATWTSGMSIKGVKITYTL